MTLVATVCFIAGFGFGIALSLLVRERRRL